MSRKLDDLAPEFKPLACELIARASEAGIPVFIVDTLRTPQEQARNLQTGASKTKNSRHLPQAPSGLSRAIDICPYEVFSAAGPDKLQWNTHDENRELLPNWKKLGEIGEGLKLRWGGRWKDPFDPGHFEYVAP